MKGIGSSGQQTQIINKNGVNQNNQKKQSNKENEYYHLPEVYNGSIGYSVNPNFKKSFFGRFAKDKKERLNSMVKMYQKQTKDNNNTKKNQSNQKREEKSIYLESKKGQSESQEFKSFSHQSSAQQVQKQANQLNGNQSSGQLSGVTEFNTSIKLREKSNDQILSTPIQNGKNRNESLKNSQIPPYHEYTTYKQPSQRTQFLEKERINKNQSQTKSDHVEYKKYLQNISITNILKNNQVSLINNIGEEQGNLNKIYIGNGSPQQLKVNPKIQNASQKVTISNGDTSLMINQKKEYYFGFSAGRAPLKLDDNDNIQHHHSQQYVNEFSYSSKKPSENQDDLLQDDSFTKDSTSSQIRPASKSYTRLPNIVPQVSKDQQIQFSLQTKNTLNNSITHERQSLRKTKKLSLVSQINQNQQVYSNSLNPTIQTINQQQQSQITPDFNFTFNPKPMLSYKQAQLREALKDKTQMVMNQMQKGEKQLKNLDQKQVIKKSDLIHIAQQVMNQQNNNQDKTKQKKIMKRSTQKEFHESANNKEKINLTQDLIESQLTKNILPQPQLQSANQQLSINFPETVRSRLQSELGSPIKYRRRGIKSSPKLPQAFREKVIGNHPLLNQSNLYHNTNPYIYNQNERSFDSHHIDNSIVHIYRSSLNQTPIAPFEEDEEDSNDEEEEQYLTSSNHHQSHQLPLLNQNPHQIQQNGQNEMMEVKLFQNPSQDQIRNLHLAQLQQLSKQNNNLKLNSKRIMRNQNSFQIGSHNISAQSTTAAQNVQLQLLKDQIKVYSQD